VKASNVSIPFLPLERDFRWRLIIVRAHAHADAAHIFCLGEFDVALCAGVSAACHCSAAAAVVADARLYRC
jgi:hypothetical protein